MKLNQVISGLKVIRGIIHGHRAFTGPVQVNINVTNRCNIRCIHCYFHSPLLKRPNMFELRKARMLNQPLPELEYLKGLQKLEADPRKTLAVIKKLSDMGTRQFQFGGYGEPFFHTHLMEFLEAVKKENGRCVVLSNGTLLSREKTDRLIDMRVESLRITTMAGTADIFVATHPGCKKSVFEEMSDNLLYLNEQKKRHKKFKPEITLVCVIIGPNCEGLFDFARFAGKIKASSVVFQVFDDVDDPDFASLIPTPEQTDAARKQLNESGILLDTLGIKHNIDNTMRVFNQKLDTKELYKTIPCYLGWLTFRLDLDGRIFPCCRCYDALGNAFEGAIHDIWNSSRYQEWRETSHRINLRKTPVKNCACNTCVHHNLNIRMFKMFHPFKSRTKKLKQLYPLSCREED